jgi:hypothetical protein
MVCSLMLLLDRHDQPIDHHHIIIIPWRGSDERVVNCRTDKDGEEPHVVITNENNQSRWKRATASALSTINA